MSANVQPFKGLQISVDIYSTIIKRNDCTASVSLKAIGADRTWGVGFSQIDATTHTTTYGRSSWITEKVKSADSIF